jgi:hypothetical protein
MSVRLGVKIRVCTCSVWVALGIVCPYDVYYHTAKHARMMYTIIDAILDDSIVSTRACAVEIDTIV